MEELAEEDVNRLVEVVEDHQVEEVNHFFLTFDNLIILIMCLQVVEMAEEGLVEEEEEMGVEEEEAVEMVVEVEEGNICFS